MRAFYCLLLAGRPGCFERSGPLKSLIYKEKPVRPVKPVEILFWLPWYCGGYYTTHIYILLNKYKGYTGFWAQSPVAVGPEVPAFYRLCAGLPALWPERRDGASMAAYF